MRTKRKIPVISIIAAVLAFAAVAAVAFFVLRDRLPGLSRISDREIREAFEELSEKNPEARDYINAYNGVTDYDLTLDLSGELTVGQIPYYTQWDARWGYCRYSSGLVGWTGCGPTALSMVAMGLTGDGTLTPAYMADLATRKGYCVKGSGTSWTFFTEGAAMVGIEAKELILWEDTMRGELNAGRPIICVMGKGYFTDSGHYIVLTGCDDEGFQVYDPFRPSNCRTFSYDELAPEIKNLWSYELSKKA